MFHWASTAVAVTTALAFPAVPIDAPVTSIDGSMVITRARVTLQSDMLFAFDSARLSARTRERIGQAAQAIARRRPRSVVVEGFTDSHGAAAYNLRLSQRRAEAVLRALPGLTARAIGRGEAEPVASNASPHGRSLNRRVEIRFR
jgi:outer membrane protein OmpA-like peptidoglycan-associated protein